jgi:hypothetical protein
MVTGLILKSLYHILPVFLIWTERCLRCASRSSRSADLLFEIRDGSQAEFRVPRKSHSTAWNPVVNCDGRGRLVPTGRSLTPMRRSA